jgi:hypothetical protein
VSYTDLKQVRETYITLRELVIQNPGGWDDVASRARVERLCDAAILSLDDKECRERLRAVWIQGADLYSRSGHLKWARTKMSGADYLRLQMLIALEAVNTRLFFLEAARDRARAALVQTHPSLAG